MPKYQRWKNIMKCYPFEEKRLAKWHPPYICQPKFDGVRCRAIPLQTGPKGNEYLLVSSEENIIYSVPHINEELSGFELKDELDGELYFHGMSFEEILSITSRTVNLHIDYRMMKFHIFDIVNEEPQMQRILKLEELRGLSRVLPIAPFWLAESLDEVKHIYDKLIALKYEGIIIRHFQNIYECKRSTYMMKFKPKKKDEYKIIGWKEEISKDGIPKGRIGSLIMSSQEDEEFSVSAGLDGDEKDRLWNIRNLLSGKSAIVHYQHLTDKKIPKGTFNVEVIEDGI